MKDGDNMVERVARAIFAATDNADAAERLGFTLATFDKQDNECQDHYRRMARAAIAAMLILPDSVAAEAFRSMKNERDSNGDWLHESECYYRAVIRAALKEGGT